MLSSTLQKTFTILYLYVKLFLLAFAHLSPFQVVPNFVQNIIQTAHFPQPINSCHFIHIFLIRWVERFSIEYVFVLALIDEL